MSKDIFDSLPYFRPESNPLPEVDIADIERKAKIEALNWTLENLSDEETDCSSDYMHADPADDGCTVRDHDYRKGRFFYKMETQELIQDRIAELKGESNETK